MKVTNRISKNIKGERMDKLRNIACSLCNCFGIPSLGGKKFNRSTTTPLKRAFDLPMEQIAANIRISRESGTVSRSIDDSEMRVKVVFAASNGGGREVASLLNISKKAGELVCTKLKKNNFRIGGTVGRRIVTSLTAAIKDVSIGDVLFDRQAMDFARTFAYSRVWNGTAVPPNPTMLAAACKKFMEIPEDAPADAYRGLESFMASRGAARKSADTHDARTSLFYNLNHECGKAFFEYGIIIHPSFMQWSEDAVAAAYMWKHSQLTLETAAKSMYDNLFLLSCIDRMESRMADSILDRFMSDIATFNKGKFPPGMGLLWMFESIGEYDRKVLEKMLRRINFICRRRMK